VIVHIVAGLVAIPVVLPCAYLLLLTALSATRQTPRSSRRLRFDVIVPAHDEAAVIERTVRSLRGLDWPPESYRVFVVADNCGDATAALARGAGAKVLERRDPERPGKGYALEFAFAVSACDAWADALVVVDADSTVSPNALEACAARIERGAGAVQLHSGVLNPNDSWRTRLMAIALAAFLDVRSRARSRLGLSCGIRGNGWCVTREAVMRVPHRAYSLAEDLEYGIELGLAGIRADYADEAGALSEMVSSERSARSQRLRWEIGRFALLRARAVPLLAAAIRRRSLLCLDLALDLLVLPLTYVFAGAIVLAAIGAVGELTLHRGLVWLWIGLGCVLSLVIHVLRGWYLSDVGFRGLLDLVRVPGFMLWKIALLLASPRPHAWIRTNRKGVRHE